MTSRALDGQTCDAEKVTATETKAVIEVTATETLTDEEHGKLLAGGYRPVVRWVHNNTLCTSGEALANIRIEAQRAACTHRRNGPTDYCRLCGAVMPWGEPKGEQKKGAKP